MTDFRKFLGHTNAPGRCEVAVTVTTTDATHTGYWSLDCDFDHAWDVVSASLRCLPEYDTLDEIMAALEANHAEAVWANSPFKDDDSVEARVQRLRDEA